MPASSPLALALLYTRAKSAIAKESMLTQQGQNHPWNSPGQNTGVGSLSLLQGMCVEPAGLCGRSTGVAVPLRPRVPRLLPGTLGSFPGCL